METDKIVTDYADVVKLVKARRGVERKNIVPTVKGDALQRRLSLGGYYTNTL